MVADLCHFVISFFRCEITINFVILGRSRKDASLRHFVISGRSRKDTFRKQGTQRATYRAPKFNVSPLLAEQFSLFFDQSPRPPPPQKKNKPQIVRGYCVLASCKASLYSFHLIQRKSRKSYSLTEVGPVVILFFPIGPKNTNLVEHWDVTSCQLQVLLKLCNCSGIEA